MSIASQLYQLQEIDLELESNEQALSRLVSRLGGSEVVGKVRAELAAEQKHLEELRRQQHSLEWEIEDIGGKLAAAEETLYSGRIKNPKELANLQHEVDGLKARCSRLEDKALEVMEQAELTEASSATKSGGLEKLEAEWQSQQQRLSTEIEQLKTALLELQRKRQLLANSIDPQAVEFYQALRRQKRIAVAKVEQGVCRGCGISVSTTELQQARGGSLVSCSSCGRILFVA